MQTTCIMRTNIYKEKILQTISDNHLLTISEISKHIPEANYSTIFRNIENLLFNNKIKKITIDSKIIAYELAKDEHDHFICNKCGTVECINTLHESVGGRKVEELIIRGICNKCMK